MIIFCSETKIFSLYKFSLHFNIQLAKTGENASHKMRLWKKFFLKYPKLKLFAL